ncbi:hypothetical protein [Microcoleus sp.]|uniref:hypothetical protein n=1 Tax=Microcoleus sp. TaxID=44472 RepID=UPI00403E73A8
MTETTHGQVFILDALPCQKQTTTLITKSKNDYIIPLKRNPKKLFKAAVKISESQLPVSENQTVDISHGSPIVRKVSVFDIEPLKSADFDGSQWGEIRSLVKVETSGTSCKKDNEHLAYYIIPNLLIISNF